MRLYTNAPSQGANSARLHANGAILHPMEAAADFRTAVLAYLEQIGTVFMLREAETMVLGQTSSGAWKQVRLTRTYGNPPIGMTRGFIKVDRLVRIAILVGDQFEGGTPKRLLMMLVDPATGTDAGFEATLSPLQGGIVQPGLWVPSSAAAQRLTALAAAARLEWSGASPLRLTPFGRPAPLVALEVLLVLALLPESRLLAFDVAGAYTWVPALPPSVAESAHVVYVGMLLVALPFLWRQSYLGYSLALAIAALLIARGAILVLTYAGYLAFPEIVSSLVLELALPTLILWLLGHLYRTGRLRNLRWI